MYIYEIWISISPKLHPDVVPDELSDVEPRSGVDSKDFDGSEEEAGRGIGPAIHVSMSMCKDGNKGNVC